LFRVRRFTVGSGRPHRRTIGPAAFSAVLPPAELCSLLNRSFEAIAAALIAEEGLLDKFIGIRSSAIRSWPSSASPAAAAMGRKPWGGPGGPGDQASLAELNAELAAAGRPPLRQGIGLHFGEVMAGNLGSSQRLEFTVIGASVIVASRLERLTRQFPDTPILISRALLELRPNLLEVVPLGFHQLTGLCRTPWRSTACWDCADPTPAELSVCVNGSSLGLAWTGPRLLISLTAVLWGCSGFRLCWRVPGPGLTLFPEWLPTHAAAFRRPSGCWAGSYRLQLPDGFRKAGAVLLHWNPAAPDDPADCPGPFHPRSARPVA